jgi:hypothetical protein
VPKGNLRVIDTGASETCTNQETALNWSQSGGQIISNQISIPFDTADSQVILNIPGFGQTRVTECRSDFAADEYFNSTTNTVTQDSTIEVAPNSAGNNASTHTTLSYTNSGINYIANLNGSIVIDGDLGVCRYQVQAVLSHN